MLLRYRDWVVHHMLAGDGDFIAWLVDSAGAWHSELVGVGPIPLLALSPGVYCPASHDMRHHRFLR